MSDGKSPPIEIQRRLVIWTCCYRFLFSISDTTLIYKISRNDFLLSPCGIAATATTVHGLFINFRKIVRRKFISWFNVRRRTPRPSSKSDSIYTHTRNGIEKMRNWKSCDTHPTWAHIEMSRGPFSVRKQKESMTRGGGIGCTFDISLARGARALCPLLLLYNSLNTHLHIRGRPRPLKNGLPPPPYILHVWQPRQLLILHQILLLCCAVGPFLITSTTVRTKIHNYSYHMTWWSTHTPSRRLFLHIYIHALWSKLIDSTRQRSLSKNN